MSKGNLLGQASRQMLRVQAAEMDGIHDGDEGVAKVMDPVAVCLAALDQGHPDGGEQGLVFLRSLSGELSMMLLAYKHTQVQTIYVDCPADARLRAKVHEKLRRQTNQLVLVPVGINGQVVLRSFIEDNGDAELFVYDEGIGWTHEPNIIGHLSDNTEASLAA